MTSPVRAPGTVLGSYRLLEVLGEGGMGVVYRAEHVRLGRRVALKMLRPEYSSDAHAVRRFFTEARAVNKIRDENIVEISDFIETPGGDNYYIMELLEGQSLAAAMAGGEILALPRAIGIMAYVASALEAVHFAGIIHRDLKPENVFLIERGGQRDFVKLLDFGVAKLAGSADLISIHRTASGMVLGTPEYMSPEQASGKAVDSRTDLYSFGVMLFELVTGRLPFTGADFGELVVAHRTRSPVVPSSIEKLPHEVPPELDELILACLAKNPDDRPVGIHSVGTMLAEIASARGWPLVSFVSSQRLTERLRVFDNVPAQLDLAASIASLPLQTARRRSRWPSRRVVGVLGAVALASVLLGIARSGTGESTTEPGAAQARTARLEIQSAPAGAAVFIDGEPTGLTTPATIARLPAGTVAIRIELVEYQAVEARLEVKPGDAISRRFELQRATGRLVLSGLPPQTVIEVDGQRRLAGRAIELDPGRHDVRILDGDHRLVDQPITITAGTQLWELDGGRLVRR
jgi:eukaryotic-like serine/threonine-protein kinase